MTDRSTSGPGPAPVSEVTASDSNDGFELRAVVDDRCREAQTAMGIADAASEQALESRRALVAAERDLAEHAAAAEPRLRAARKLAARDAFELALLTARDDEQRQDAVAGWGREIDRINRETRLQEREVARAKEAVARAHEARRQAELHETATRLRAEQAQAACLAARVRLAASAEGVTRGGTVVDGAPDSPPPGARLSPKGTASERRGLTVIEAMVSRDPAALDLAAARIGQQTGVEPSTIRLLLVDLVQAIVATAAEAGYLLFDPDDPLWSGLTLEESRDVISALGRLGFLIEPGDGWHAQRAPGSSDLSVALAYAGLDARQLRMVPDESALRLLPRSIAVDARAFLATHTPELDLDALNRYLGQRAEGLGQLWDVWGFVRPVLLGDRPGLGSVPG
jgi:hypothetical protein